MPHDHAVSFYEHDVDVVTDVARYVADGLARDEYVVVVATRSHLAALDEVVLEHGADPARARAAGRYVTLDAKQTLDAFMVDGAPDPGRFLAEMTPVLADAPRHGARVRVFGEMVAILWDEGNVTGAIALEGLWNELAAHHRFSLLCAYPSRVLDVAGLGDVSRVCELHSVVLPPPSYGLSGSAIDALDDERCAETFVPVPEAVAAVRHFVTHVLQLWGEDQLVPDAAVVTSEIATNAVKHAVSAFRATIERSSGVVRISIEDVGSGHPLSLPATGDELSGRGVAMVEALSVRWGFEVLPTGKVVWAELARATTGPDRDPHVPRSIPSGS